MTSTQDLANGIGVLAALFADRCHQRTGRRAAARADSERGQQPRLEVHDAGAAAAHRSMSAFSRRGRTRRPVPQSLPNGSSGCDVIASNWSAYPEMAGHQWGEQAERAFVEWIKAGHGFVVFHAAAATSQDWPEFQQLVQLTWGIDKTSHGAYHTLKVTVRDSNHPITRGMRDFWITDELWHNMVNLTGQEMHALCEAFSEPDFARHRQVRTGGRSHRSAAAAG